MMPQNTNLDSPAPLQRSTLDESPITFNNESPVPPSDIALKPGRNKNKIILWIVIILGIFLIIGLILSGIEFYDRYLQKVALEKILPSNPNFVARITLNPDSPQFQMLEQNMQKFPGYNILKKDLDKSGEGKTLSQALQDNLKEQGLDFQADIEPALGEQAYLLIPDLSPLSQNLQQSLLSSAQNLSDYFYASSFLENSNERQIAASNSGIMPKVLGDTTDIFMNTALGSPVKPLDFIVASEIKDVEQAKKILDKLKKNTDKYEMTDLKFSGYAYYKIKMKPDDSQKNGIPLNYSETYNAFLGNNWISTSKESDMKNMIARRSSQHALRFFAKKDDTSLENNSDFQKVKNDLETAGKDNLFFVFCKLNFNDFFKEKGCTGDNCSSISDYIKYPDDIVSGYSLRLTPEGAIINFDRKTVPYDNFQNTPLEKSMATKIPEQVETRYADALLEYHNLKSVYYNLKKNNLTEKGLEKWNELLNEIRLASGVDLETDFIDLLSGNTGLAMFSKKDMAPAFALIMDVDSSEKMLETMKKIFNETIMSAQSKAMEAYAKSIDSSIEVNQILLEDCQTKVKGVTACSPQEIANFKNEIGKLTKQKNDYLKKAKESKNIPLTETVTSDGTIYSFSLGNIIPEALPSDNSSIVFSIARNQFILSSDRDTVAELMRELNNPNGQKLSASNNYAKATSSYYPQTYSNFYLNTLGLWNVADYYIKEVYKNIGSSGIKSGCFGRCPNNNNPQAVESQQKQEDAMFAVGSIIRTLKLFGASTFFDQKFIRSNLFINIEELRPEEKSRAEKTLGDLDAAQELSNNSF